MWALFATFSSFRSCRLVSIHPGASACDQEFIVGFERIVRILKRERKRAKWVRCGAQGGRLHALLSPALRHVRHVHMRFHPPRYKRNKERRERRRSASLQFEMVRSYHAKLQSYSDLIVTKSTPPPSPVPRLVLRSRRTRLLSACTCRAANKSSAMKARTLLSRLLTRVRTTSWHRL